MKLKMKAVRANKDLSLEEVAKQMNVSVATVHRWENGITPIPLEKLIRYCEVCDVNIKNVDANIKVKGEK